MEFVIFDQDFVFNTLLDPIDISLHTSIVTSKFGPKAK